MAVIRFLLFLLSIICNGSKRLVPTDGSILHCCGQANPDLSGSEAFTGYSEYLNATTRPVVFMVYLNLNNAVSNMQPWFNTLENILNSYGSNQFVGVQLGLVYSGLVTQVANGEYDNNIDALIAGMKSTGRPFWVRIGYEFNGEWNDYNPASDYIKSFQKISTKFQSDSWGNKYIASIWDFSTDAQNLNYMEYYPGDQFVDWWGVNIFSGPSSPNSSLVTSFAQDGCSKGFPVILGESTPRYTGVTQGQTSWDQWFQPYFNELISNKNNCIKQFCYINWNWTDSPWATWGDAEIENNQIVGHDYQSQMYKGNYFHSSTKNNVLARLGLSVYHFIRTYFHS